mgnify:CR=1 FL=1
MSVDALEAMYAAIEAAYALKYGDITAVRAWLYFDQADTVTGVARHLRTHCVDGWHQFLGEQIGGMLAWPPESIEEVIRGVDFVANTGELLADGLVKTTNAVEARFGRDRAIENYEFSTRQRAECKKKREELKDLFGEDWRYLRDVVDRELKSTYCVKRMRERPEPPREFCWGFLKDVEDVDAELAEEVAAYREYLRERDAARSEQEKIQEERAEVATDLELAGAEARWLKGQLEFHEREVARLEAERQSVTRDLDERTRATEWLEGQLAEHLGTRVHIQQQGKKAGKGKLVIEYFDLDQFDGLLAKMGFKPS